MRKEFHANADWWALKHLCLEASAAGHMTDELWFAVVEPWQTEILAVCWGEA